MLQKLQMNRVTQELLGPKRKTALEERQLREKLEAENKQEVFQRQRELQSLGHIRIVDKHDAWENCNSFLRIGFCFLVFFKKPKHNRGGQGIWGQRSFKNRSGFTKKIRST